MDGAGEGCHGSEEEDPPSDCTVGIVKYGVDVRSAGPVTRGDRSANIVDVLPLQLCIIREMSSDGWQWSRYDLVARVEDGVVIGIIDDALERQNARARAVRRRRNEPLALQNYLSTVSGNRKGEPDWDKLSGDRGPGGSGCDVNVSSGRKGCCKVGVGN